MHDTTPIQQLLSFQLSIVVSKGLLGHFPHISDCALASSPAIDAVPLAHVSQLAIVAVALSQCWFQGFLTTLQAAFTLHRPAVPQDPNASYQDIARALTVNTSTGWSNSHQGWLCR